LVGLRRHLGEHVGDARFVADELAAWFDARGGVHIALPLGDQRDQEAVEPIDLLAHLGHGLAILRGARLLV